VHVDAYRLGGRVEVDDLDLDASVEDSVTLVEWGEGLVEELTADRLEVEIERAGGDVDANTDAANPDAGEDDEHPLRVRNRARGPRWAPVDLSAVTR
jgi:tRNA threonylcarbamoyladenosine biosynthesis protein TsaE